MICQHCGHETESGKFCTNCGSPLEPIEDTPSTMVDDSSLSTSEEKLETFQEEVINQPVEPEVQHSNQSTESTNTQSEPKQTKKTLFRPPCYNLFQLWTLFYYACKAA